MIKAQHSKIARLLFDFYIRQLMRKTFGRMLLVNEPPAGIEGKSLLITPNHFSWWDGFFIHEIVLQLFPSRRIFLMMLETQLRRYWFFRYVGAYSIEPTNPKSIIETIRYTREALSPDTVVVMYPQGEIEPFLTAEITLRKGLMKFLERENNSVVVLPVAFGIQYENERKPDIYVRFGKLLNDSEITSDFNAFEKEFRKNVTALAESAGKRQYLRDVFE